jgi:hypothetical protein
MNKPLLALTLGLVLATPHALQAQAERHGLAIYNATDRPQQLRFRWGPAQDFGLITLLPGNVRILENAEAGEPEVEYDGSPAPGLQLRQKKLEAAPLPAGKEARWRDAQRYVFVLRDGLYTLQVYAGTDFPPGSGEEGKGKASESFTAELKPREERIYQIEFRGGRAAQVSLQGQGTSDVDLFILEGTREIARDDRLGDICHCAWLPRFTATFVVKIQNLDFARTNKVTVAYNGKVIGEPTVKALPGKEDKKTTAVALNFNQTVNLLPMRDSSLRINLPAGKEVAITAIGQGTTRVDMIIIGPDGRSIEADNAGADRCQAVFTPSAAGEYSIRLRNYGSLLNQVRVTAK